MKNITLDYFKDFQCKKGECKNNCCVGWEICIDKNTYKKYKKVKGDFKKNLKEGIDKSTRSFVKNECGRCAFLNKDNLCDIIINLGENALCDICRDHPRYRCYLSDRVEYGIGLSCEKAVELVLSKKEKAVEIESQTQGKEKPLSDFEKELLSFRKRVITLLQDREFPFCDRVDNVLSFCGIKKEDFYKLDVKKLLLGLENLDGSWRVLIENTDFTDKNVFLSENDTFNEQISVYFAYRHLLTALDGLDRITKTLFSLFSTFVINAVSKSKEFSEVCRMYSAEIEYSSENLNAVFDVIDALSIKSKIGGINYEKNSTFNK